MSKMTSVQEKIAARYYDNKFIWTAENKHKYVEETKRLEKEFKSDLEVEFDVLGHPKADKLFDLAWSFGHGSGFYEVYFYYSELSELVIPD